MLSQNEHLKMASVTGRKRLPIRTSNMQAQPGTVTLTLIRRCPTIMCTSSTKRDDQRPCPIYLTGKRRKRRKSLPRNKLGMTKKDRRRQWGSKGLYRWGCGENGQVDQTGASVQRGRVQVQVLEQWARCEARNPLNQRHIAAYCGNTQPRSQKMLTTTVLQTDAS